MEIGSLLLKYLIKQSSEPSQETYEGSVMSSGTVFRNVGFFAVLLGPFFVMLLWIQSKDSTNFLALLSFTSVISSLGLYMLLYYKNTKVKFNDTMIQSTNFLGKSQRINWSDIETVDYKALPKWLVLKSDNRELNVPIILKGFSQFKESLTKNISNEKYKKAFEKIDAQVRKLSKSVQ